MSADVTISTTWAVVVLAILAVVAILVANSRVFQTGDRAYAVSRGWSPNAVAALTSTVFLVVVLAALLIWHLHG